MCVCVYVCVDGVCAVVCEAMDGGRYSYTIYPLRYIHTHYSLPHLPRSRLARQLNGRDCAEIQRAQWRTLGAVVPIIAEDAIYREDKEAPFPALYLDSRK